MKPTNDTDENRDAPTPAPVADDGPLQELVEESWEQDEPLWHVTVNIDLDRELAEQYGPAFKQALDDPETDFYELVHNCGRTKTEVTIHGYDPEYYYENRSDSERVNLLAQDVVLALDDADEPLDRDSIRAAVDLPFPFDDGELDAALEDLQIAIIEQLDTGKYTLAMPVDRADEDNNE